MSSMNNLDLMVRGVSINDAEYESNKSIIAKHFDGEIRSEDLPQRIKDVLFEWEIEEMELTSDIPMPWEDNDG